MEVLPSVEHQDVGQCGGCQPVMAGMVMLAVVKPQGAGKIVSDSAHSKLQALVGVLPSVEHQYIGRCGGCQPVIVGMVTLTMVKPQGAGKRVSDGAHSKLQASVGVLPSVEHQGAGQHGGR